MRTAVTAHIGQSYVSMLDHVLCNEMLSTELVDIQPDLVAGRVRLPTQILRRHRAPHKKASNAALTCGQRSRQQVMSTSNKRSIARFFVSNRSQIAEQAADTPDNPGETASYDRIPIDNNHNNLQAFQPIIFARYLLGVPKP